MHFSSSLLRLRTATRGLAVAVAVLNAATMSAQIAPRIQHDATPSGIELYALPTGVRDVVTLRGSLPAGDAASHGGKVAVATLVGEMLDQGTTTQDKFTIAAQLDAVGAELNFSVGNDTLNISGRCLRQDLPLLLNLLVEQLRNPAFQADDLEAVKTRLIGSLQRAREDPDNVAAEAFNNAIYPASHPNFGTPLDAFIPATAAVTVDDLKAFHASHYGPHGLILVLVGDVDAPAALATLTSASTGWRGGSEIVRATAPVTPTTPDRPVIDVTIPDKTSVSIVWGQATGLRYTDPDSLPLSFGTAVLGSGFTGRLLANVRDKEGLTYGIGASAGRNTFNDGEWSISATFAPALLDQGIASTRHQLESWWTDGVTAQEFAARQTNLVGTYKLQLATTGGIASTILRTVQRGEPLSAIDDYPARIEALTLDQVNGAIHRHLDPTKMTLVRAGTLPTTP